MSHLKAMFSKIFSHITMVTTPSPSLSLGSLDGSSERRERREGERERREVEREREGGRGGREVIKELRPFKGSAVEAKKRGEGRRGREGGRREEEEEERGQERGRKEELKFGKERGKEKGGREEGERGGSGASEERGRPEERGRRSGWKGRWWPSSAKNGKRDTIYW